MYAHSALEIVLASNIVVLLLQDNFSIKTVEGRHLSVRYTFVVSN